MSNPSILEHQRGLQVQGSVLRLLRAQLGWTQHEFAKRAGYSERLIRKAESSGFLMPSTIHVLAETLTTEERKVQPADLCISPRRTIDCFLDHLFGDNELTMSAIADIATSNVEITGKGNSTVPFSGTYFGRSGLVKWMRNFRKCLASDQEGFEELTKLVENRHAFVHTCVVFNMAGQRSPPLDLDLRFKLSMGYILSLAVSSDTLDITRFFEKNISSRTGEFPIFPHAK